jgi:hypothetical protein
MNELRYIIKTESQDYPFLQSKSKEGEPNLYQINRLSWIKNISILSIKK